MAAQAHTIPAAPSAIASVPGSDTSRLTAGASRLECLREEARAAVTSLVAGDCPAATRSVHHLGISDVVADHPDENGVTDSYLGMAQVAPAPLPSLVSALSRRSAIFGALAVGTIPATAAAANVGNSHISTDANTGDSRISFDPNAGQSGIDPDAQLIALGREWQASAELCDRASNVLLEAEERIVFPEPPEALFRLPGDTLSLVLPAVVHRSGRHWYGAPAVAACLRDLSFRDAAGRPVAADVARRAEIVGAMEEWDEACRAERLRAGADAALVAEKAANAENSDLRRRIVLARAHTLPGLLVKARVAGWWLNGSAEIRAEALHAIDIGGLSGEAMAFSIAADLAAMAERESA